MKVRALKEGKNWHDKCEGSSFFGFLHKKGHEMDATWAYLAGLLLFLGLFLVFYAVFLPRRDKEIEQLLQSYRFRSDINGDK